MKEVIEYLEMKNHYYEKFCTVTQRFLDALTRNDWQDIEFYVDSRERILSILRGFDIKIADAMKADIGGPTEEYRKEVTRLMEKRSGFSQKIVSLDLQLISLIDEYKSETIRELRKALETEQQVDTFQKVMNPASRKPKVAKA